MLLAFPLVGTAELRCGTRTPAASGSIARTGRLAWAEGHDIRFLGLLFLVSAANDAIIIAKNPDYLLPFSVQSWTELPASSPRPFPISPYLGGVRLLRIKKWSLLVYLVYAAYGTTNALVNLTCFGPGRIRNTLLIALIAFTSYILWRRRMFQR